MGIKSCVGIIVFFIRLCLFCQKTSFPQVLKKNSPFTLAPKNCCCRQFGFRKSNLLRCIYNVLVWELIKINS